MEPHVFLGVGPGATGGGPGWTMRPDLIARCVSCDYLMPLDPDVDDQCSCGRLRKDVAGRFGSTLGDQHIEIYRRRS